MKDRSGGGILPLGGAGEDLGGHKGYGLAFLVDILCGVLPGAAFARFAYPKHTVQETDSQLPGSTKSFRASRGCPRLHSST